MSVAENENAAVDGAPAAPDFTAIRGVLLELEGREVSLALADGSRLDAVTLVSAGRGRTPTVWLFAQGIDLLLPRRCVIAAWEARPARARRAAYRTLPPACR
jgi:hypothetical protein